MAQKTTLAASTMAAFLTPPRLNFLATAPVNMEMGQLSQCKK